MKSNTRELFKGRIVRGNAPYVSEQGSVYEAGISRETVGSEVVFLGTVTLPPGQRTRAHIHARHESAFYMLSGESVELWTGEHLQHCDVAHVGDYLFIPANTPHVAVNRSATMPAIFVGVRNEATAQESVVLLPHLDVLVV